MAGMDHSNTIAERFFNLKEQKNEFSAKACVLPEIQQLFKMKTLIETTYNDVISENRNKAFGQYELRTRYSDRLFKAQAGVLSGLSLIGLFLLLHQPEIQAENPIKVNELTVLKKVIIELDEPKNIRPKGEDQPATPPPAPPPAEAAAKPVIKSPLLPMEVAKDKMAQDIKIDSLAKEPASTASVIPVAPSGIPGNGDPGAPGLPGGVEGGKPGGSGPASGGGSTGSDDVKDFVEIDPEFQGNLEQFIAKNTRYPGPALRSGVEGQVFVTFVVDERGKVTRPEILKGIGFGCDEEAMRVIRSLPDWKPGKNNGNPVKVRMRIPLRFRLNE
jgi:protein TonB